MDDRAGRAAALEALNSDNPLPRALLDLLAAGELASQDPKAAAARLLALADRTETTPVYREIAILKAVTIPESGLTAEDRRARLEGLAIAGGLTGLLADEQLAYLDIEAQDTDAGLKRLQQIVEDAGASAGLRQRASQMIVALGGDVPERQ